MLLFVIQMYEIFFSVQHLAKVMELALLEEDHFGFFFYLLTNKLTTDKT